VFVEAALQAGPADLKVGLYTNKSQGGLQVGLYINTREFRV